MGHIISLKPYLRLKTVDFLLEEASESHTFIHRLMAEARLTYGTKSDTFEYVRTMLSGIEGYINNSTKYLEWVQDRQAELAITGNLPIETVRERYKKLGQRIADYEAAHPQRIIAVKVERQEA